MPSYRLQELFHDLREGVPNIKLQQAKIGPSAGETTGIDWDRPEVNKTSTTVQVPQDEDTPMDAFRKVPRRLAANYTVEIDETGDYSAEDWVIPPVQSEDLFDATEGGNSRLTVTRQGSTGTLNPNSVFIIGGRGQGNVVFQHTFPVGVNPYDDEQAVWAVYGGGEPKLSDCGIGGSARSSGAVGVLSYTSIVKIEGSFDWGSDLVSLGGRTKQCGMIIMPTGTTVSGSVTDHAWEAPTGVIQHGRQGPTSTNPFADDPQRNGGVVSHLLPMVDRSGNLVDAITIESDRIRISGPANNDRIYIWTNANGDYSFTFHDKNGNAIARLTEGGNLILAGSVTENGSP